jgi:hypothetical protein
MSLTKGELIKLLRHYHFKESSFYEQNKNLLVPVNAKSPNEAKFEIRKDDVYTYALKSQQELTVYFKKGKHQAYESINLERK